MDTAILIAAIGALCTVIGILWRVDQVKQTLRDKAAKAEMDKLQSAMQHQQDLAAQQCRAENEACRRSNDVMMARVTLLEGKHTRILEQVADALTKLTDTEVVHRRHEALDPKPTTDKSHFHG